MVRGLQGSDDGTIGNDHVAATLKHFAGYAGTTGGRNDRPTQTEGDICSIRKFRHFDISLRQHTKLRLWLHLMKSTDCLAM